MSRPKCKRCGETESGCACGEFTPEGAYTPKHLKRWTLPSSYSGAHWGGYYRAGFGESRDSDCLERINFAVALERLQAVSDRVERVEESHWAVGWVAWIAIPEDDYAALKVADQLRERYENYPVLDDDRLSDAEQEEADAVWRDCYSVKERIAFIRADPGQFNFHNLADMLGCVRGKYFAGYASELIYRH